MSAETLRKWVRQAEVDAGKADGVSTEMARELRELKRKNAELERTIEVLKAATSFFARECDPRHAGDLRVHRRAQGSVRGRSDLPCAAAHGVQIAPSTYYAWAGRAPSKRALWDATITELLAGYYEPDAHGRRRPEWLYGSLKMWAHLQRAGHPGRPVHRGAADAGQRLARRDPGQDSPAPRSPTRPRPGPPDLVGRQFRVPAPNRLLVADFT